MLEREYAAGERVAAVHTMPQNVKAEGTITLVVFPLNEGVHYDVAWDQENYPAECWHPNDLKAI